MNDSPRNQIAILAQFLIAIDKCRVSRPFPRNESFVNDWIYWLAWCDHCQEWHRHGPMNEHREAHCTDESSPYWKGGYNIEYAGRWIDRN